jgi:uncharacterized protein (DUF1330 family)
MKTHYAVALAMVAGFGVGAGAVQTLHAQAKPPLYYITEINVTDPVGFAKNYLPIMQPLIKADGGRYVALGGPGGGGKVTSIEGAPPAGRVAVLVWDSVEQVHAHRDSEAFKTARKIGENTRHSARSLLKACRTKPATIETKLRENRSLLPQAAVIRMA